MQAGAIERKKRFDFWSSQELIINFNRNVAYRFFKRIIKNPQVR